MSNRIPVTITADGVRLWVDPASVKVPDRRRNSRLLDECFVLEYAIDLDVTAAAARCGITRNPGRAGMALFKRNKRRIAVEFQARAFRLQIDADFVLSELMRQYVRLTGMLGHDMACLYTELGGLKPMAEWPEAWRTRLVTEITSEELSERSHDGETADKPGGWDRVGTVTKVKRETTLAIERELRECLKEIGRHVNVKAFPVPQQAGNTTNNFLVVTAETARKVAAARKRLEAVDVKEGK